MPDNNLTREQWETIKEELQGVFCHVQFQYQNIVITVCRERQSESRTVLMVYFDGKINLGWGDEKCQNYNPTTSLFWFKKSTRLYSLKKVAEMEKSLGKRAAKRIFPNLNESIYYMVPWFTSSATLIRQFKKTEGLSLIPRALGDVKDA